MSKFPSRMFRWAAIYGVIVLLPMYLFTPLQKDGAEVFLGFVGLALVFQALFWMIGRDPAKYRPLMPLAVAEKVVFAVPCLALWASRYPVNPPVALFACIDLLLGLGFFVAWQKSKSR